MSVVDAVDAPLQRHRNVPILYNDGPKVGVILAFAERPLMANDGYEWAFRLRPLFARLRPVLGVKLTLFEVGVSSGFDP